MMIEVVLLLPIRREVCLMPTKGQRQRQLQNVWDVVPMGNGGKMPVLWMSVDSTRRVRL